MEFQTATPEAERERLKLLRSYGILDTPPEEPFEAIVAEAIRLFDVSSAAMTLIDDERCWFKARRGLDFSQTPRDYGLCGHAFRSSGVFVVADAMNDELFRNRPLVVREGFRFYAAAPLIAPEGHSFGTLCVLDRTAREATRTQIEGLQSLAHRVVALLVKRRNPAGPASPANPVPAAPERRAVLVVDDEDAIRSFVRLVLERRGLKAIVASDGQEGLQQFRAHAAEIGIVITDINMPKLNGLELLRILRREPTAPTFVAITGRLDLELRAQLSAEGVACILSKPFNLRELEAVIVHAQARSVRPTL